jgi:hypothetical protein
MPYHDHVLTHNKIYDLSVDESGVQNIAGQPPVVWTAPQKASDGSEGYTRHVPFFPAGNQIGWSPFTPHIDLPAPVESTIDEYLSRYEELSKAWVNIIGAIDGVQLMNHHDWNITRVLFMNQASFPPEPGSLPNANVSVVAVYLMEMASRPVEFVWWEITPLSWVVGWERPGPNRTSWYDNYDVPKSLEEKLLGSDIRTEKKSGYF